MFSTLLCILGAIVVIIAAMDLKSVDKQVPKQKIIVSNGVRSDATNAVLAVFIMIGAAVGFFLLIGALVD